MSLKRSNSSKSFKRSGSAPNLTERTKEFSPYKRGSSIYDDEWDYLDDDSDDDWDDDYETPEKVIIYKGNNISKRSMNPIKPFTKAMKAHAGMFKEFGKIGKAFGQFIPRRKRTGRRSKKKKKKNNRKTKKKKKKNKKRVKKTRVKIGGANKWKNGDLVAKGLGNELERVYMIIDTPRHTENGDLIYRLTRWNGVRQNFNGPYINENGNEVSVLTSYELLYHQGYRKVENAVGRKSRRKKRNIKRKKTIKKKKKKKKK
tara:strand:+ start:831 stop:1604 length:774 start_codon:yes stop_codon:yes gene_type:complete